MKRIALNLTRAITAIMSGQLGWAMNVTRAIYSPDGSTLHLVETVGEKASQGVVLTLCAPLPEDWQAQLVQGSLVLAFEDGAKCTFARVV